MFTSVIIVQSPVRTIDDVPLMTLVHEPTVLYETAAPVPRLLLLKPGCIHVYWDGSQCSYMVAVQEQEALPVIRPVAVCPLGPVAADVVGIAEARLVAPARRTMPVKVKRPGMVRWVRWVPGKRVG